MASLRPANDWYFTAMPRYYDCACQNIINDLMSKYKAQSCGNKIAESMVDSIRDYLIPAAAIAADLR